MNLAKPSTVVGGGEMKRVTSSVVSNASREDASLTRSSRSVMPFPCRTGSCVFQSELTAAVVLVLTMMTGISVWSLVGMCVAISSPLACEGYVGRVRSTLSLKRTRHST